MSNRLQLRTILLEIGEVNSHSIQIIVAAAFMVCLDEGWPENSEERFLKFLFGNGSNRWHDKTLRIIVAAHSMSASLCKHSTIDGLSVEPLHDFIHQAIQDYRPSSQPDKTNHNDSSITNLQHLPLISSPLIDNYIPQLRQTIQRFT